MEYPFSFWDKRYSDDAYIYGTLPNRYFKDKLDAIPNPGRLLLLAEGEGRNAVYAAEKGWQVSAVDFSRTAQDKALKLAAARGVSIDYQVGNVQDYPFDSNGPWDAIGLIYAHFPSTLRSSIHQKCAAALAPNGTLILEAFNRNQMNRLSGGPKNIDLLYSKQHLEADFEGADGIQILELGEATVSLQEGLGHEGLGDVVRFLGIRI